MMKNTMYNVITLYIIIFLKGECNINATDKDKRTPLIICVSQGHTRIMEVLIAASKSLSFSFISFSFFLSPCLLAFYNLYVNGYT